MPSIHSLHCKDYGTNQIKLCLWVASEICPLFEAVAAHTVSMQQDSNSYNMCKFSVCSVDFPNRDSSYTLNYDLGKNNEMAITTARESILKLMKLQSLVAKCCKLRNV